MGNLESVESGSWLTEDGTEINAEADDFYRLADHIDSLIKVAEISSVSSRFEGIVNEDVTLIIESRPDTDEEGNGLRVIEFKIRVDNWKDYTGGSSVYSRMEDNIEYQESSEKPTEVMYEKWVYAEAIAVALREKPTEVMYEMGSLFHFLDNSSQGLLDNRRSMSLFFRLDDFTDEYVTYKDEITVSKFDDS